MPPVISAPGKPWSQAALQGGAPLLVELLEKATGRSGEVVLGVEAGYVNSKERGESTSLPWTVHSKSPKLGRNGMCPGLVHGLVGLCGEEAGAHGWM